MAVKYNMENRAVKRIQLELKEMQSNPSGDFMSLPLEENIFEWQFAIRGPRETEFEGGIYHGLIQFPAEYPFKPPSLMLLTPNGRFETQAKIWLSISNHHPEHWQPSWSVRTALVALIAFMPTSPNGALGSLDYKKEERRALAIKSREAPPRYGTPERQKLIDEIHEYMLSKAPPVPQHSPLQDPEEQHPESWSARGGGGNNNDNGWTQGSFTNNGEGSQDFRDVSYDNGGWIQGSFTNNGEGYQNFRDVSYNNGPYSGNGNIIIHKGLVIKALEDGAGGHYTIVL